MNKKKIMFVLLAGLVLGACSSDDDGQVAQEPSQEQTQTPQKSYPLSIEVAENPMIQDGEEGSSSRRAAITTGTTLSSFKLNYAYSTTCSTEDPVTATKDTEGKWTSEQAWPDINTDVEVTWYAKTGGALNLDGSNPYINFSTDETAVNQHDLLIATTSGTWTGTKGNLSFTFDHACSAVHLFVKKSKNLNGYTLNISKIVLHNVVKQGKYYYGTETWDLTSNIRTNYTLYEGSAKTLGSADYEAIFGNTETPYGTSEAPYLFLIPQTMTAWDRTTAIASATTQCYLELTCTIVNTSTNPSTTVHDGTAYIPFAITTSGSPTLEKGKKYNVKINIGKNSLYSGPGTKIISD